MSHTLEPQNIPESTKLDSDNFSSIAKSKLNDLLDISCVLTDKQIFIKLNETRKKLQTLLKIFNSKKDINLTKTSKESSIILLTTFIDDMCVYLYLFCKFVDEGKMNIFNIEKTNKFRVECTSLLLNALKEYYL